MKTATVKKLEPVSKLYARALFELALERNEIPAVQENLGEFVQLIRDNSELGRALSGYLFSSQDREALVRDVAQKIQLSPLVQRFVELLAVKNRISVVEEVYTAFRALVDQNQGIVRGTVTTVEPLSEAEAADLAKTFSKKFNKQVVLEPVINKEILGGLVVSLEGKTFDGSLKTTIRRLRETLERQAL